jgi:protocatechuate 3,4-dioxygenase beta subunit
MRHAAVSPTWDDVQTVLDEEIQRLPATYRAVFVLCVLEGKSGSQAAFEFGVKEGAIRTRLTRARQLLQQRLARRGIKLASVLAALSVAEGAGQAGVSAALARTAIRFGLLVAAGNSAAGVVPSHIAALAAGVTRAMFVTKTKIAVALLLAAGIVSAACGVAYSSVSNDEEYKSTPQKPVDQKVSPKKEASKEKKESVTYSGRAVDPDGKPVAGAKVYYYFVTRDEVPTPARATTNPDGRFVFTLTPKDVPLSPVPSERDPLRTGYIVVKADGFTFAWRSPVKQATDVTFQLARDDSPVEGRIVDLQGKPVAGVCVRVLGAAAPENGNLDDFLEGLKKRDGFYMAVYQRLPNWLSNSLVGSRGRVSLLPETRTDADGRFRIHGFARELLVELRLDGPTIERKDFYVVMRGKAAGADNLLTPALHGGDEKMYGPPDRALVHWNGFEHAAAPGQVVTGTVRDEQTKAPLAGAMVESYVLAGTNVAQNSIYHTVADANGRYRFTGLPRGKGTRIRIHPPSDQSYIPLVKDVPEKEVLVEATVDADLPRGVFVDVTVKDKKTGQPVHGLLSYFTFPDKPDPKVPFLSGPYHDSYDNFMPMRPDGTFRFVAAPRKAILAFRADWSKYPIAKDAPTIQLPASLSSSNFAAFVEINPKLGEEPAKVDFVLDAGGVVKIRVVGPDGQPLTGALAAGLRHDWYPDADLSGLTKTNEFTAIGLDTKQPRLICFTHWDKKLAGSIVVRGDEQEPVTVKMQPWGSVSGRLLDADGQPIKKATLWFTEVPRGKTGAPRALDVGLHVVERFAGKPSPDPVTDEDGRFKVEGLIPGLKYNLGWMDQTDRFDLEKWKGLAFSNLVLKSGETKALGDVKLQPFPK